jgi:hypothetical protein
MKEIKKLLLLIGFVILCILSFKIISEFFFVFPLFGFTLISFICLIYLLRSAVKFKKWDMKHQYIYIYIILLIIANIKGCNTLYNVLAMQ